MICTKIIKYDKLNNIIFSDHMYKKTQATKPYIKKNCRLSFNYCNRKIINSPIKSTTFVSYQVQNLIVNRFMHKATFIGHRFTISESRSLFAMNRGQCIGIAIKGQKTKFVFDKGIVSEKVSINLNNIKSFGPNFHYEKTKCLSLIHYHPFTVPGLMSLDDKARSLFLPRSTTDILAVEYRTSILLRETKIIFNAFYIKHSNLYDCINHTLDKLFIPLKGVKKSFHLYKILSDKQEISLMQHLLCLTFGNKKIPYYVFEKYCISHGINPKSYAYDDVNILAFIECKILSVAFQLDKRDYSDFIFSIINDKKLIKGFDVNQSLMYTDQRHADVFITYKEIDTFYGDIKANTHNGYGRATISIFQGDKKNYESEISNIITSFDRLLKEEHSLNCLQIRGILKKIKNIKNNKEISLEERFKQIYDILLDIYFNSESKELKLSISNVITGTDDAFEIFVSTKLKHILKENEKQYEVLTLMFPRNSVLTDENHLSIINYFIENIFDISDRENIRNNFSTLLNITYNITTD